MTDMGMSNIVFTGSDMFTDAEQYGNYRLKRKPTKNVYAEVKHFNEC